MKVTPIKIFWWLMLKYWQRRFGFVNFKSLFTSFKENNSFLTYYQILIMHSVYLFRIFDFLGFKLSDRITFLFLSLCFKKSYVHSLICKIHIYKHISHITHTHTHTSHTHTHTSHTHITHTHTHHTHTHTHTWYHLHQQIHTFLFIAYKSILYF